MTCPRSHIQNSDLSLAIKHVCLTIMLTIVYPAVGVFPQNDSAHSRFRDDTDCAERALFI